MNGVFLLDKPTGFTSFDAVAVMRGLTRQKRIGHTGTLDPMATGVLPLLLGKATRAESLLPNTGKEYRASFSLGYATNTQDSTGRRTAQSEKRVFAKEAEAALSAFRGDILQLPPMYSAVQVNGQRLYDLARKGIEVEREKRPINISRLELLAYDEQSQSGELIISCSKGTYIRTICHDLGAALGTYGVMTALRRTMAAGFVLEDCATLEEARALKEQGELQSRVLPVETLFLSLPPLRVSEAQARRFGNGGALALDRTDWHDAPQGARCRVQDPSGVFLGLGEVDLTLEEIRVVRVFLDAGC